MKIPGPPKTQVGTLLTNASLVDPKWSIPPKPDPGPTWRKWLNMPEVELWQAVALSCNIEPPAYYPEGLGGDFDERMDIALAHLVPAGLLNHVAVNSRRHTSKVALADIARLAKSCQWQVPAEFPKAEASLIPAPVVAESASGGVQPDRPGPAKPLQRTAAQDSAILCEIKKQGYDPIALPKNIPGKPGAKAAIRAALSENSLFTGGTVFDKAWERLTAHADIAIQG